VAPTSDISRGYGLPTDGQVGVARDELEQLRFELSLVEVGRSGSGTVFVRYALRR
jgi:hypothetical protein